MGAASGLDCRPYGGHGGAFCLERLPNQSTGLPFFAHPRGSHGPCAGFHGRQAWLVLPRFAASSMSGVILPIAGRGRRPCGPPARDPLAKRSARGGENRGFKDRTSPFIVALVGRRVLSASRPLIPSGAPNRGHICAAWHYRHAVLLDIARIQPDFAGALGFLMPLFHQAHHSPHVIAAFPDSSKLTAANTARASDRRVLQKSGRQ